MPYTALDQYAQWDTDGATPTWKRLDLVTGGDVGHPSPAIHRTGIGAEDHIVYGLVPMTSHVEGELQTFAWSAHPKRATVDALPAALQLSGGLKSAGICAYRHRSMYINEVTLACAGEDEPWTYSMELVGLTSSDEATPSAAAVLGQNTMEWYQGSVKVDTASYVCDSAEATLRNGLIVRGSLDEGTASQLRWGDYVKVGNMEVECSLVLRTPLGIDLRVDEPEDTQYDVVFVMKNDTTTKTLTMTNLYPSGDEPVKLETSDTEIMWDVNLVAPFNTLTTWTIV